MDRNKVLDMIKLAHELEQHVLLYGPVGTGKTTDGRLSAGKDQSVHHVTLTAEGSAAGLTGHYIPHGDKFEWHDGPAILAWRQGGLLLIDEIDKASPDCSDVLHMVLNDPMVAEWTLPTNETITPHPNFRVVATMNGEPEDLAPAVLDRFKTRMLVDRPSEAQLKRLSRRARAMCENLYANKPVKFTYRQLLAFDAYCKKIDPRTAASLVTNNNPEGASLAELYKVMAV